MSGIPYARHQVDDADVAAVEAALRSDFLTTGPRVEKFENALKASTGAFHVVVVSSGTAALHLALLAGGVGPGDEVLVPTLSFAASANAVLYVGARPVFVDSLPGEFLIDPNDAARKITSRTKAVIPVHFAGQPAPMDDIARLAADRNLLVVEDAAHALGAQWKGRPVGSLSAMTVFSFHPVKHVTSGEGGAIAVQDATLAARLRRLRHHGIDVDAPVRDRAQRWEYDLVELGFNYRLSDIHCALGTSQLGKLPAVLHARAALAARYDRRLADDRWLLPPRPGSGAGHAWHLYVLRLAVADDGEARDGIFSRLRAAGVGAHVHYKPIHLHSHYRGLGWKPGACPEAERLFPRLLTLPLYPGMSEAQQDDVVNRLREAAQDVLPARRSEP